MALLNAGAEAVDKNARSWRKNKIALYWEGDDGSKSKFTFQELSMLSNQFGNLLKQYGVEREDRVFFFLPRVPELFYGFIVV